MKIALMTGPTLDTFQQEVLAPILDDKNIEIAATLIDCRPKPSARQRLLKNLRRGRGGYMLVMLAKSRRAQRRPSAGTRPFLAPHGISCIETTSPYDDKTIQQLKALQPEAMVMLGGFGIVREPLLTLAPRGILSYHHGDMRRYRGQPVGFWELYNGEREMGVTVQRLSAGIDKGTPIVERTIAIAPGDRVETLCNRALEQSTDMMHEALRRVADPDFQPAALDHYGPIYTLPNLRQYITLKIKLLFRTHDTVSS